VLLLLLLDSVNSVGVDLGNSGRQLFFVVVAIGKQKCLALHDSGDNGLGAIGTDKGDVPGKP